MMLRLALGIAFGLVVTACGTGASSAPRLSNVSARHAAARQPTTADNRRAAKRSAARLLARIVLPSGAVRLGAEPRGDGGLLRYGWRYGGDVADPHRFWRVHATLGSVMAFVNDHPPSGSQKPFLGWGRDLAARMAEFDFRPSARRVWSRRALIALVPLPHGWTAVRTDGEATWVVERSAAERVPNGVREVDVRAPKLVKRVTNPAKVGTIVRLFNELPLARSVGGKCVVPIPPYVRLVFRSGSGAPLARATVPDIYPGCVGITFTIHGRGQPELGEQIRFIGSLQRLLGVPLPSPPRR